MPLRHSADLELGPSDLDKTNDDFNQRPTNKTAGAYLRAAIAAECDEAISTEDLLDVMSEILAYLEK